MVGATVNGDNAENGSVPGDKSTEVGSSCVVKKFWEGKSSDDRIVWLTEPPAVEKEDQDISESPEYAITLLHRDVSDTGTYKLDAIILRGPVLQKFLEDTIPDISSYYDETDQGFRLRTPFRLLYWYLDHIKAAAEGQDKQLAEVAALLHEVLNDEFQTLLTKRKELLKRAEMNFDTLWTVFKPGITCLTDYVGHLVAVKVTSTHFSRDGMGQFYYRIHVTLLGWNGEHLGWQDSYTDIFEFNGRRKVNKLEIYPIEFHEDPKIANTLAARGRKFVELAIQEPYMMSFNGEVLDRQSSPMWWQGEQKKKMSERVTLDARAYNHYHRRLPVTDGKKRDELHDALKTSEADQTMFLFCCTEFHCFALQQKKWARVWIDSLDEVVFNETAYPSLVLPNDYKELLLSFAEAQIDGYDFDDVIAGKGQGILMLLAGSPGTGKTLTAEAMAEHMKRPLYSVSMGEIGASAGGIENELNRVLELSTRWNAVLLLDEADVFLEKRTDNDIQRNTIVSIFLKKLEYYRGIMFLTTNRIDSFDDAFKSRVHVAIRYPDLDSRARYTIWQNFLKKANEIYSYGVDVKPDEIEELSQKTLNGREIRNIIKTSQLLASRSKQVLTKAHLDKVWKVEHEDSPW